MPEFSTKAVSHVVYLLLTNDSSIITVVEAEIPESWLAHLSLLHLTIPSIDKSCGHTLELCGESNHFLIFRVTTFVQAITVYTFFLLFPTCSLCTSLSQHRARLCHASVESVSWCSMSEQKAKSLQQPPGHYISWSLIISLSSSSTCLSLF